jgi:hypothetical protein
MAYSKALGLLAALALAGCSDKTIQPPGTLGGGKADTALDDALRNSPSENKRISAAMEGSNPNNQPQMPVAGNTGTVRAAIARSSAQVAPAGITLSINNGTEENKQLYAMLPIENGLHYKKGPGTRSLVIFSDPSSAMDIALFEQIMKSGKDMDVAVSILPYDNDRYDAGPMIHHILCTKNPEESWANWMSAASGRPTQISKEWEKWAASHPALDGECKSDEKIEAIRKIAKTIRVENTPAIIFGNGQAWPGNAITREDMERVWYFVAGGLIRKPDEQLQGFSADGKQLTY